MSLSHRKVKKELILKDAQGNALANKQVKIEQTSHSFLFGCGAFEFLRIFREGKTDEVMDITSKWLELFNYGTLPFYWGRYEPEEGKPDQETLMKTAMYLQDRGVRVKGHPLCWHTVCADWLMKYDNATILKKQLERIRREVTNFKGVIDMWDVINEVVIMPVFDKYDNAVTRICNDRGRIALVKDVFAAAHESNPEATLLINDFNLSESYRILIDGLLNAGVPIGAIGIQTHQHQGYMGKEKVLDILKRYEVFGLPIHFTENTLISGEIMPSYIVDLNDWQVDEWPTTPEGEERQCREIEEMYRTLFDHPLVEAITTWDFRDGAWLKAPAGFLRLDNSLKPSYKMLKKLIKEEWSTNLDVRTDGEGRISVEGFKGDYCISVDGAKAKVSMNDDSTETIKLM
ncbi:MAG: endo-1,4-beta-xylanase [Lachnospiraceae bacterium]|nr:endo-1,4-beta-xylanase [Lachnospiraceae bacterium]